MNIYKWTFGFLWAVIFAGCTKVAPMYTLKTPAGGPDTTHDVLHMLDSVPGCALFAQAVQRAGVSGQLDPADFFTVFIPDDSAMTAAGLTSTVIDGLSPDSLSTLVLYLITYGAISDSTLTDAVVSQQQNCLLETLFYDGVGATYSGTSTSGYSSYRHALFVKNYGGVLNINGWPVNAGEAPIKAVNGYLYPIHIVLRPPTQLLWTFVQTRPELSYYLAAIRMIDSITATVNNNGTSLFDSTIFSQLHFEPVAGSPYSSQVPTVRATVFAPTNTAFVNAGIPDIPSLQNLILGEMQQKNIYYMDSAQYPWAYNPDNIPGQGAIFVPGIINESVFNFFPLDSVFKLHYLYNANANFTNALCYSDLTGCPSINNGVLNASSVYYPPLQYGPVVYLPVYHSGQGGVLDIQWNPGGLNNAVIERDKSQLDGVRNFWALNGVIYESDRLFLPN